MPSHCSEFRFEAANSATSRELRFEPLLRLRIGPKLHFIGSAINYVIHPVTRGLHERLVDLEEPMPPGNCDGGRYGRKPEGFGEALLALLERGFRLRTIFEVREGEKH